MTEGHRRNKSKVCRKNGALKREFKQGGTTIIKPRPCLSDFI